MTGAIQAFKRGFLTPLESLKLVLDHPKLMGYFIMPMLLTLLAAGLLIYGLIVGFWGFLKVHFYQMLGSSFDSVAPWVVGIVALFALYGFFVNFTLILSLASSPFNDLLAYATEKTQGNLPPEPSWASFIPLFFLDLRKTVLAVLFSIVFWAESLIPVVGFLSFFGFAIIQTFTMITYPQNRRGAGILASLRWMGKHFFLSLGFGCVTLLLFMIPFVNVFALPLSIIGGTLLFIRSDRGALK